MNSPRSLEACRILGILPESLYYIDFKTYVQNNPEIIRYPKDIQKKDLIKLILLEKKLLN